MLQQVTSQETDWTLLLREARAGDDQAFGEICDRLTEYLLLTVSRKLDGGLAAKFGASDVVQQALLEAQQGFSEFRGSSEGEFRSWLAKLVQHTLIDFSRHFRQAKKRDTSRELSCGLENVGEELCKQQRTASSIVRQSETDDELLRAVAQLSDRRRRVIELRNWQELSFAEVGKELGISEVAARNLWTRTVEELRRKIRTAYVSRPSQPH